jgi:hypothetical protein
VITISRNLTMKSITFNERGGEENGSGQSNLGRPGLKQEVDIETSYEIR